MQYPDNETTVGFFKSFFVRDFKYISVWDDETLYNKGTTVFYTVDNQFYIALQDNIATLPTDTEYWALVESETSMYVLDSDIEKAYFQAKQFFNNNLFDNETDLLSYICYLIAHYLVIDLQMSQEGINSTGYYIPNHTTVGDVSESYSNPANSQGDSFILYQLNQTRYGQKYLSLISPLLVGHFNSVRGTTTPF